MSRLPSFLYRLLPHRWLLWLPVSLLWLEGVVRVYVFHSLLGRGLLYIPLFTLTVGLGLDFLCSLFRAGTGRRLTVAALAVCTGWYMVQTVYFTVGATFLTLYSVGTGAGPITQYWREILLGILESLPVLVLEGLPFFLLLWRGRLAFPLVEPSKRLCRALAAGTVGFGLVALLAVSLSTGGLMPPRFLYWDAFIPELSVSNFGVMTTLSLDARHLVFGPPEEPPELPEDAGEDAGTGAAPSFPTPVLWESNALDIDFEALAAAEADPDLADLHRYFGGREVTAKNEYTGLFEGKNLIFLTAEGFSPYAVDPALTPTLYRLANSGFVFENYYTPLWWVSTSDGEYVNCQSLIPTPGMWSMAQSGANELPLTLGNQFRRLGYGTYAYHNHFYDYYARNVSHPNMGYSYKGRDGGLEMSDLWPESDLEMMRLTVPEYLKEERFHVYYMTVSGHLNYDFEVNQMAAKYERQVAHLDLSEQARAYLACNMELDRALKYLLDQLGEAGILKDTVICLAADHYPYGLDKEFIDELAGHEVEEHFELYKSTLILWSGDMEEPVVIDKPCSSLDILPTLSNLFGLKYDSRLMMGRDILSDSEALVVFSSHSFLTEHGRYNAHTDEFTPYDDVAVPASYARELMEQVNDMFYYSAAVLEHDYYSTLGLFEDGRDGDPAPAQSARTQTTTLRSPS